MDKVTQDTESIYNLIESVEMKKVMLPEFQRDFVWDIGQTYDLFDSIVRDIFIGSIIYGIPSFGITVRGIDERPRKTKGKRRSKIQQESYTDDEIERKVKTEKFRLLLDGQQRVTALYRALRGIDKVWFISKNEEDYKDGISSRDFDKLSLEEILYVFSGKEDENRLSVNISDAFTLSRVMFLEQDIKENFFNKLSLISKDGKDKIALFRQYLIIIRKLQDLFKQGKLIVYYLLNMNTEKFALFFERSNSRGVQLNFIDILAAKLYSGGFVLRKEIEKFEKKYGERYIFNREIAVRSISYIVSECKNVDKGYILSNLGPNNFIEYWNEVCELYVRVLDFLYNNNFIISQSWMPYENMIIPLVVFLRELPSKEFSQMNEKQREFIEYWYWASIFSQRYSSATNDVILQDAAMLKCIAKEEKIYDKTYLTRLKVHMDIDDIYSYTRKGSSVYQGILNLINYCAQGLKDWNNASRISFNLKIDDHHIFPEEYLENLLDDEEIELIDCVANRTLIPKILNIKIGKSAPSDYLGKLKLENNRLEKCLESHLISADLIAGRYDGQYMEFLKNRANRIYNVVKETVIDKYEQIFISFYEQVKVKNIDVIDVFAKYKGKVAKATLFVNNNEVMYKNEKYSVSAAADIAKKDMTGKDDTSTNGWYFWKYMAHNGKIRPINDFRK